MITNITPLGNYETIKISDEKCNMCKNKSIIAVCTYPNCQNNGGLCYNCIYKGHINHGVNCVPVSQIKVKQINQEEFINDISCFVKCLETTREKINTLINDQIKEVNDLRTIHINSLEYLTKLAFWHSLEKKKDEWYLSIYSIKEVFHKKFENILNILKVKINSLIDDNSHSIKLHNGLMINYNINPTTSINKGHIEEDTLIFSPMKSGMIFSGFGLFSEIEFPDIQIIIALSKQEKQFKQQRILSSWKYQNYKINNMRGTLFKIDKTFELDVNTKYILNIKVNYELLYSTNGFCENSKLNNNVFSFYEVQGEPMLKKKNLSNNQLMKNKFNI